MKEHHKFVPPLHALPLWQHPARDPIVRCGISGLGKKFMSLLMLRKRGTEGGMMLWVISRFIFPASLPNLVQLPRCSFLFSLLHFIPLGDFPSPPLSLLPSPSSPLSPFELAMDSYYYDGRRRSSPSRPVLRGERENGPGNGGTEESHFGYYFEVDFRTIPISVALFDMRLIIVLTLFESRYRTTAERELLLSSEGSVGGSSALPSPLSG